MRIVVLTNNNSLFGKKLIQQIEKMNIPLEGIVILNQPFSYHINLFKYVKRKVGFLEAILFSALMIIKSFIKKTEKIEYSDFKSKIHYSNGTNTNETEQLLAKLNADIIVLGQTGIIRKNIIKLANIGVLNAHPGILPYYRGIDCLKWSIFNNEFSKIGCSVHWVTLGVDTGPIISTHKFELNPTLSIDKLEWNLNLLCISELVKTLQQLKDGNLPKGIKQKKEDGKQYYKMPILKEITIKRKIQIMKRYY